VVWGALGTVEVGSLKTEVNGLLVGGLVAAKVGRLEAVKAVVGLVVAVVSWRRGNVVLGRSVSTWILLGLAVAGSVDTSTSTSLSGRPGRILLGRGLGRNCVLTGSTGSSTTSLRELSTIA